MKAHFVILGLAIGCLWSEIATATSCATEEVPIKARIEDADAIFIGKFKRHIKDEDIKNGPFGGTRGAIMAVSKVFKGTVSKEVAVYFKPARIGCSGDNFTEFNFKIGRESDLLMFAKSENGKVYISQKIGYGLADAHNKDLKFLNNSK